MLMKLRCESLEDSMVKAVINDLPIISCIVVRHGLPISAHPPRQRKGGVQFIK